MFHDTLELTPQKYKNSHGDIVPLRWSSPVCGAQPAYKHAAALDSTV